jgi:hypothetical protein
MVNRLKMNLAENRYNLRNRWLIAQSLPLLNDLYQNVGHLPALLAGHIQVGDGADGLRAKGVDQEATLAGPLHDGGRVWGRIGWVKNNDVGLHRSQFQPDARTLHQLLADQPGVGMVFTQAGKMVNDV